MRRVNLDGPMVLNGGLYGVREGTLVVGSENWYNWLEGEGHREFVFRSAAGEWYRARREWRRECAYWYVACRVPRVGGRVRRFYLGAVRALDEARLATVATAISADRARAAGAGARRAMED
jgi:hypothetical protein